MAQIGGSGGGGGPRYRLEGSDSGQGAGGHAGLRLPYQGEYQGRGRDFGYQGAGMKKGTHVFDGRQMRQPVIRKAVDWNHNLTKYVPSHLEFYVKCVYYCTLYSPIFAASGFFFSQLISHLSSPSALVIFTIASTNETTETSQCCIPTWTISSPSIPSIPRERTPQLASRLGISPAQ